MSALCRCYCGCDRLARDLNDATSSWLVCMSCCLERHRRGWWECPTCGHGYSEKPEHVKEGRSDDR